MKNQSCHNHQTSPELGKTCQQPMKTKHFPLANSFPLWPTAKHSGLCSWLSAWPLRKDDTHKSETHFSLHCQGNFSFMHVKWHGFTSGPWFKEKGRCCTRCNRWFCMVAELTCSSCLPGAVGTIFLETFGKLRRWKLCLVCEKRAATSGNCVFFMSWICVVRWQVNFGLQNIWVTAAFEGRDICNTGIWCFGFFLEWLFSAVHLEAFSFAVGIKDGAGRP